jgi:hypothetical protein
LVSLRLFLVRIAFCGCGDVPHRDNLSSIANGTAFPPVAPHVSLALRSISGAGNRMLQTWSQTPVAHRLPR